MIVYGRNPVREALRGRRAHQVTEVWATHGAVQEPWLAGGSLPAGVLVHQSTPAEVERRCGSAAHQGVCAQAGGYPYVSATELLARTPPAIVAGAAFVGAASIGAASTGTASTGTASTGTASTGTASPGAASPGATSTGAASPGAMPEPLIVALDEVQDPQNLGSICRTAECAGASGVAICERRAAEVTPAVCKASAGAVEHLRIARVRNLADFLGQARDAGCWCYGASAPEPEADRASEAAADSEAKTSGAKTKPLRAPVPYDALDYSGAGVVLVLGSEGRGLRPRVAGACDELVALPLRGRIGSLNVSAVAAVMMYEILQRGRA